MYYFHKKYSFSHCTAFFPNTIFFRSYSDRRVWSYHNTTWTFLDIVGLKSVLYDSHTALKKKEVTVGIRNVSHFCYCRLQRFLPRLVSCACPECLVFLTFCGSQRSTLPFSHSHLRCVLTWRSAKCLGESARSLPSSGIIIKCSEQQFHQSWLCG